MKILIYNHSFFYISETFIHRQITGLPSATDITLLSRIFVNDDIYPTRSKNVLIKSTINLSDRIISSMLKRIFGRKSDFSLLSAYKIKRMIKESNFDLIHAHFGFNAVQLYKLVKEFNIPFVVSFHGIDASAEYLDKKQYKKDLKDLFEYAKAIIIVSPHMIESLELTPWINKTHLIPYGIDANEFISTVATTAENDMIKILHSGRVVSKKGVPDLIEVCMALNEKYNNTIQLDVIGEGPELEACQKLVEEKNAININFLGAQTQNVVKEYMSNTDIFVLNSREGENGDMEGFPNAILEAMSMSLPVVSTYHAGIPVAITNDVDGLLVEEKDNEALEAAIERLILDRCLRNRLGEAARIKVKKEFTIDKMNQSILGIYQTLV